MGVSLKMKNDIGDILESFSGYIYAILIGLVAIILGIDFWVSYRAFFDILKEVLQ